MTKSAQLSPAGSACQDGMMNMATMPVAMMCGMRMITRQLSL